MVRSDTIVKKFVCTPSSLLSGRPSFFIFFLQVIFTVTTGLLTRQAHFSLFGCCFIQQNTLYSLCALGSLISVRKPSFEKRNDILTGWFRFSSTAKHSSMLLSFSASVVVRPNPPHSSSFNDRSPHLTKPFLLVVYTNTLLATLNIRKSVIRPTSSGGGGGGVGGGGIGSRMVVDRTLSLRNLPSSPISPHVSFHTFLKTFLTDFFLGIG